MSWSPEQRMQLLGTLDLVTRALTVFYRCLMALVISGILIVSVWVFARRPFGAGNQGEYFYFGAAALFLLGCALNQFILAGRPRRRWGLPIVNFETKLLDGGRAFEVHMNPTSDQPAGADVVRTDFSRSFSIPIASLAVDMLPNEESLACLEGELSRGVDLDTACRTIQPAYESWRTFQRRAYQMYVKSVLAARQQALTADN